MTAVSVCSLLSFAIFASARETVDIFLVAVVAAVGVVQGSAIYFPILGIQILKHRSREKRAKLEHELRTLQEHIQRDFVTNLVRINFKYIDRYYLQTQVQADKSFLFCLVAALVSFCVIIVGIVLMFVDDKFNAALVTLAAGVLGEFNATVFFYLYNRTIAEMGDYHQKLVLTQNISLALKLTDELEPKTKSKAQLALIDSLCRDVNYLLVLREREVARSSVSAKRSGTGKAEPVVESGAGA